jgi:small basic protein
MTQMNTNQDISQGKSIGELGREALWFLTHTFLALAILGLVIGVIWVNGPDPESANPKLLATVLAFFVPMVGGFFIARMQRNEVASYVWISGLVFFSIVCVWVLDLPTGPGLCEDCGAVEKLWRTFFSINHGSGLMAGDGLFLGTWIPFSMIGYAVGARFGLAD